MTMMVLAVGSIEASEQDPAVAVRARAEGLLQLLRAEQWEQAAAFVLADEVTQRQIGVPEGTSSAVRTKIVAQWFQGIYGSLKPGAVSSVRFDPADARLALVSYKHGDLDGFYLRYVEGAWWYTLDGTPHPQP